VIRDAFHDFVNSAQKTTCRWKAKPDKGLLSYRMNYFLNRILISVVLVRTYLVMHQPPDMETEKKWDFECTAPSNGKALMTASIALIFTAACLMTPGLAFAAIFPFLVFFFSVYAALNRDRFLNGVILTDSGFECRRPLRKPKRSTFVDILRIEAVVFDSPGNDIPVRIHTPEYAVLISEDERIFSGIWERIMSMEGFNQEAYVEATYYEVTWLESFTGKKFVVYERPNA
jgi:hypothetical protein